MDDNALWNFSLDLYGKPGVPAACLALQEAFHADVNLVLFGIWRGTLGHRLSRAESREAAGLVAAWHFEVVVPLRALRVRLKSGPKPAPDASTAKLRDAVKAAELDAERVEHEWLHGLATTAAYGPPNASDDPAGAAAANLLRFLGAPPPHLDESSRGSAGVILAAAFPGLGGDAPAAMLLREITAIDGE